MEETYFNRNRSPIFPEIYDGVNLYMGDVRKEYHSKNKEGVRMVSLILRFSQEFKDFYHYLLTEQDIKQGFTIFVCKETEYLITSNDPLYPRRMILRTSDGEETQFSRMAEVLRLQVEEQQKIIEKLETFIAVQSSNTAKWLENPQQAFIDQKEMADRLGITTVKYIDRDSGSGDPLAVGNDPSGGTYDANQP